VPLCHLSTYLSVTKHQEASRTHPAVGTPRRRRTPAANGPAAPVAHLKRRCLSDAPRRGRPSNLPLDLSVSASPHSLTVAEGAPTAVSAAGSTENNGAHGDHRRPRGRRPSHRRRAATRSDDALPRRALPRRGVASQSRGQRRRGAARRRAHAPLTDPPQPAGGGFWAVS